MHKTPEGHPIDHIGDGVYVEWDGFALRIRVNSHLNPVVVTLEPFVLEALNRFYKKVTAPAEEEDLNRFYKQVTTPAEDLEKLSADGKRVWLP